MNVKNEKYFPIVLRKLNLLYHRLSFIDYTVYAYVITGGSLITNHQRLVAQQLCEYFDDPQKIKDWINLFQAGVKL